MLVLSILDLLMKEAFAYHASNMQANLAILLIVALSINPAASKCPPAASILPCRCIEYINPIITCDYVNNFTATKLNLANKIDHPFFLSIIYLNQSTIEKSTVSGLNLEYLTFRQTILKEIEADAFADVDRSLVSLQIKSSNLESIPVSAFRNLEKLRELEIINSKLTKILKSEIDQLPMTLSDVSLKDNAIVEIENQAFSHLSHLLSLSLDNCTLNDLPKDLLPLKIVVVELRNNNFTSIPIKTFSTLSYALIGLEGNQIQNFPAQSDLELFLKHGNQLKLEHNPLNCTCGLKWVMDFKKKFPYRPFKVSGTCAGDAHRRNKTVEKLKSADFADC